MNEENRAYFTAEEKIQILKRALVEKVSFSDLSKELNIHPNRLYEWQEKLFTEGSHVFNSAKEQKVLEKKVVKLTEDKLKKDEVISELMVELLSLKKKVGEN